MSQRERGYDPNRIRFELAARDDDRLLLENLSEVFQRELTPEWHEWFAYESPHGRTRYYLARDLETGDIAATYGLMSLRLRVEGETVNGALSVNTGARTVWRGTGLFQDLGRYALETDGSTVGTVISLGVPNRFSHNVLQRIGWEHIDDIAYLARKDVPIESTDAEQIDEFTPEIDRFLDEGIAGEGLAVSKDHLWLNWRYSRPDQSYTRYLVRTSGVITGYVVLKRFFDAERDVENAHIVDIRASNPEVLGQLVNAAYCFSQGVSELNTWAFAGSPMFNALHEMGFRQTEETRHLILYRHALERSVELPAMQDWNFVMGDTDVF